MTMPHPTIIVIPEFTIKSGETTYLKGRTSITNDGEIKLLITQHSTNQDIIKQYKDEEDNLYGCCGQNLFAKTRVISMKNHFILDQQLQVTKLTLDGVRISNTSNCLILLYDDKVINQSESIYPSSCLYTKLSNLIQDNVNKSMLNETYDRRITAPSWVTSSMIAQHCLSYYNLINWLWGTIKKEKCVSIKSRNLIMALMSDILLGYIFLQVFIVQNDDLSDTLMWMLEYLVNLLYSLLKWLMGAPAGLKLNKAFNNMLGKYFAYHIQLWWLFLDVSRGKMGAILHVYQYIGYLGFTFQAAIISDMISMATFHLYCIYVYAARLFNIQVSGLIALLRLFVGRKYNPLRGSIDSCEYTYQELFVGTVAFTILLLLLPTSTMYYVVFMLFRLMALIVRSTLAKVIYLIQTLPLYVVALWITQSPKVAGKVLIEVQSSKENSPLILRVKLSNQPLGQLINRYKPPVDIPKNFEWTDFISNVLVGKQLI